jgi:hypothetical protein
MRVWRVASASENTQLSVQDLIWPNQGRKACPRDWVFSGPYGSGRDACMLLVLAIRQLPQGGGCFKVAGNQERPASLLVISSMMPERNKAMDTFKTQNVQPDLDLALVATMNHLKPGWMIAFGFLLALLGMAGIRSFDKAKATDTRQIGEPPKDGP